MCFDWTGAAAAWLKTQGRACLMDRMLSLVNLELDLHGERFFGVRVVQTLEPFMDYSEINAQLVHLVVAHEEPSIRYLVGGGKDAIGNFLPVQQDLLGHRGARRDW